MRHQLQFDILIVAAVILGSCNERIKLNSSEAYDLADAAQANARTAIAQNDDQDTKINRLELELRVLEARDDALEADLRGLRNTVNDNARIYNEHLRRGP